MLSSFYCADLYYSRDNSHAGKPAAAAKLRPTAAGFVDLIESVPLILAPTPFPSFLPDLKGSWKERRT